MSPTRGKNLPIDLSQPWLGKSQKPIGKKRNLSIEVGCILLRVTFKALSMVSVYAYLKLITVIVVACFLISFGTHDHNAALVQSVIPRKFQATQEEGNSSHAIRFINTSSLKRLPAVISDLSVAINEPAIQEKFFSGVNGFAIYLYDANCNSFERSATVQYAINDTLYHLKLNRFNNQAIDRALATTLIHEITHCVLLDMDKRAKRGDENALASILNLGLSRNDTSNVFNNEFFVLMNSGDEGQHELMYRLFYTQMVFLLERFAEIHNEPFFDHKDAANLMWSGLQRTNAYHGLNEEEKQEIELAILKTKGVDVRMKEE